MSVASRSSRTIFLDALERAAPEARKQFVDSACGHDARVRSEVQRLLDAHGDLGGFMAQPAARLSEAVFNPEYEQVGAMVGRYRLLEKIGEGGMGVVYVAEQTEPVRRRVALKLIKPGIDTRQVIARFEAERQALAMMDHPNIAKVLDAGTTGEKGVRNLFPERPEGGFAEKVPDTFSGGRPYFVMELVRGLPITDYCDRARIDPRGRLELFATICQAVQHAHQKGIIHRDIKPSNVMVTLCDGQPVVKIIDFGVAKAVNQRLTEQTIHTAVSEMIGTPLYMSPEQATLGGQDIDTRSDVYSLGVLLYELLTGQTPFDDGALVKAGLDEVRRIIREDEPPTPSHRIGTLNAAAASTVSERRGVDRRQLGRVLRNELDWIVMKAFEKDRNRRYESASALGLDTQRYLNDEPIQARPVTPWWRARKWARRHPTTSVAASIGALASVAIVVGVLWHNLSLGEAQETADGLRRETAEKETALRREAYPPDVSLAFQAWQNGRLAEARSLLDRHRPDDGEPDRRGFEWHYLRGLCEEAEITMRGHEADLLAAALLPDDRLIASADASGVVKIWELATGRELQSLKCSSHEATCVRFSPDGQTLAVGGQDQTVSLWDVATWSETGRLTGHTRTICSIDFSPDGRWLVSGARDNDVKIWDVAARSAVTTLNGHTDVVRCVAWSPNGTIVATAGADSKLMLWEPLTWRLLDTLSTEPVEALSLIFNRDGGWLLVGGYGRDTILYNVNSREEITRLVLPGIVWSLALSPDTQMLVAGHGDGQISCLENCDIGRSFTHVRNALGHAGKIRSAIFTRDAQSLITVSQEERTLKRWSSSALFGRTVASRWAKVYWAVSPGGERALLSTLKQGILYWHELSTDNQLGPLDGSTEPLYKAAFSPRGNFLATTRLDGDVSLWDAQSRRRLHRVSIPAWQQCHFAFSPDERLVAIGGDDGEILLCDVTTGQISATIPGHGKRLSQVLFSPDGLRLASCAADVSDIGIWKVPSGEPVTVLHGGEKNHSMGFNPDGRLLAVGGHSVELWDMNHYEKVALPWEFDDVVQRILFSPDGRVLVTVTASSVVELWDVATRRKFYSLPKQSRPIRDLLFASDRRLIITTVNSYGVSRLVTYGPGP